MTDSRHTDTVDPSADRASPGAIRLFAPGTEISARYEIREVLGTGGFAVVYRAFDRTLAREVALKVLRPDRMGAEALRRFRREVALARDVGSPRLVRIFDIEDTTDVVYYAMELVEGESLRERLRRGPLGVREAVRLAGQILEGLGALHGVGVVHRDVKPANVLLTKEGDVKLCDLGLARELEGGESMTATDAVVGTLDYLAPEQALGKHVDGRADLYALGCVLFEMLTGSVPHKGETSMGTLVAHVKDRAPRVATLRHEVPAWLDAFTAKLLETKATERYPSARAALSDLERARVSRRPHWRAVGACAAALALCAVAAFLAANRARPLPRLAWEDAAGLRAFDAKGRLLWHADDIYSSRRYAFARLARGASPKLVAVRARAVEIDPAHMNVLSVLDPWTGRLERTVRLPSAATYMAPFADHFGVAGVDALDLDGDGVDEILVSEVHDPYYPSYTVLWEPALDRARIVFLASGHHYPVGAADVDGDGRKELILAGQSNRLGWNGGVAAVRMVPPVGVAGDEAAPTPSGTPDREWSAQGGTVVWYALVPLATYAPVDGFDVDAARRWMRIRPPNAPPVELDFDGFTPGSSPSVSAPERQAARRECYARLRDAMPLVERFEGAGALGLLAPAAAAAERAGDRLLLDWIRRVETRALIAAGRDGEARRRLEAASASGAGIDAVLEGATAFHLRGALAEAVRWYRRGLAIPPVDELPRQRSILLLEGEILALSDLSDWAGISSELDVHDRSSAWSTTWTPLYREWMRWRMGLPADASVFDTPRLADSPAFFRYAWLEARLAAGERPEALLPAADDLLRRSSDQPALALAFRAELLHEAGRGAEALDAMRKCFPLVRAAARRETEVRAHLRLVTRRYAEIAAKASARKERAEALLLLGQIDAERARERALYGASGAR